VNIPGRYCTGYLGDIGVPEVLPMDFSASFGLNMLDVFNVWTYEEPVEVLAPIG